MGCARTRVGGTIGLKITIESLWVHERRGFKVGEVKPLDYGMDKVSTITGPLAVRPRTVRGGEVICHSLGGVSTVSLFLSWAT